MLQRRRDSLQTITPSATALHDKREAFGYLWGIAAPCICSLVDWPLQRWLGPANILMTYLLGVFLIASRYGRGASVVASLLSVPAFAFYYARPIFSFAIHDLENIIGLTVMIVVSIVTGSLLEKARLQAALAEQRESQANALYRLSRDLSSSQDHDSVARIAVSHIHNEFNVTSILLSVDAQSRLHSPSLPIQNSLTDIDLTEAQQTFESREPKRQYNVTYYPIKGSRAWQGILLIQSGEPFPSQKPGQAAFFDAFCHLIGQTLERLDLDRKARAATLQAETEALRNALLSSISHDLRTPLTHIIGAASALLENDAEFSSMERQDFNHVVLEEAQRMSDLTGKLLDMARLSSGEIILHRDWNALEEIVGSALNRLDKQLHDRPVRTVLADNLPLLWVDAVLIEQVLLNLIENAIKYSSEGSPIDICANAESDSCRLTVVDYGPGITKGQEMKIFEKFYRGSVESGQSGVGLGLALCKAIIEAHGGEIQAGNRVGKGAEFVLRLPLYEQPPLTYPEVSGTML